MRTASFADMNCSIARALEVVGEWWTPLIVRDAPTETRDAPPLPTHQGAS